MLSVLDSMLLAGVCLMAAMTPGISLAVISRHTLAGGHGAGMTAGISHAIGIGLWATATVTGLAMLLQQYPVLARGLSVLSAVFLLWLAWQSWRTSHPVVPATAEAGDITVLQGAARDGFTVAFLNPKVGLFFLALFSQFLSPEVGIAGRVQMVATATLIDGSWYVLVALLLGRSRLLPWLRHHHQQVERATAVLLGLVAVSVLGRALLA